MSNPTGPDGQNIPRYGTPEYAAWYQQNVDPGFDYPEPVVPEQAHRGKGHGKRNGLIGLGAAVALIVGIGVGASGGDGDNGHKQAAPAASHAAAAPQVDTEVEPTDTPTQEPAPTPDVTDEAPTDLQIGGSADVSGEDGSSATLTVSNLRRVQSTNQFLPSEESPAGFLAADLDMSVTAGVFDINPYDFVLRSDAGLSFEVAITDVPNPTNAQTVTAGRKYLSTLAFDVPTGFTGTLEYAPNYGGVALYTWRIG